MEKFVKDVAKEISDKKSEILSRWIKKIKDLGGSYSRADIPELKGLCSEFLGAFLGVMTQNDFSRVRIFIDKLCNIRSSQGFRLSEVQRAYYSFYDVIKPIVEDIKGKESVINKILELVNSILVDTMIELSESYHRELNNKLDTYVNEIENINEKLKERSIKDALTGCYNHGYFHTMLSSEITRTTRYTRPLSIIIFDIDHFKKINDTFGHPFGNEVLKNMGKILKETARESDIVFRYGGEEFSIILPETNKEQAFISAERIRKKIAGTTFHIDNTDLKITISGGIEGFIDKPLDKSILISNADKALYRAKKNGRNQVIVYNQEG